MRVSEPTADKFKKVCEGFPNLAVLTKSSTPGEIQLTFGHAAIGNKSLEESVVSFALTGDLSSPFVISFNTNIAFAADGDKICLPIAEVLLRAAARDLAQSKRQRDWTSRKAVVWRLIGGALRGKKLRKGMYVHYIHITYVTVFTGVNI